MTLKCIAIDDEPLALDIIEDYVSKVEFLELEAKTTSAIEALKIIKSKSIDLVFLDIQMPELSGFEILESLDDKPLIIFTSAYDDYAVDSYNYNAIDYLLKPFSFARFLKSVEKAQKLFISNQSEQEIIGKKEKVKYIFVNVDGNIIKLFLNDILFIKSLTDYIEIKTSGKKYIVRESLKDVEKTLASNNFIRVHKSYIVSLSKIDLIEGNTIKIHNEEIPIGRSYRNTLLNVINTNKIG